MAGRAECALKQSAPLWRDVYATAYMKQLTGKILALDIGTKRIGYAVSDEQQTISFPRGALAYFTQTKFIADLRKIAKEEGIKKIVIGVPLDENNIPTDFGKKILGLSDIISRELLLPVEYADEFGSTNEALAKIPFRKDRKREQGQRDAISAQIILQRYLDAV